MATFLEAVNDVLVLDGILAGDDDEITSFSSTQHVGSIRFAKRALRQELAELVADEFIPAETFDDTIQVSAGNYFALLPDDFIRFQDESPWLYEVEAIGGAEKGNWITEYPGGFSRIRKEIIHYRITQGKPTYWYWLNDIVSNRKLIGFYPVANALYTYRIYYEKELDLFDETTDLPFATITENTTFIEMAARRFKYLRSSPQLREKLFPKGLAGDPVINESRNRLLQLMRYKPRSTKYGRRFR